MSSGKSWGEWILHIWKTEPERIADPAEIDRWQARMLLEEKSVFKKKKKKAKVIPIDAGKKAEDFSAGEYRAMFRGEE